jgi:hypothetical protein
LLARTRHRIRRSGPASGTSAAGFDGAARRRCRSVLRASRSRSVMACRNPALKASSNSAVSTSTRSTRRPRDAHEPAPGVPRGCGVAVGDDQDLRARDIGHRIASPWRSPGRSQARSASLSLTMSLREVISSIRAIAVSYAPPSPTPPRPAGPGHPGRLAGAAESICLEGETQTEPNTTSGEDSTAHGARSDGTLRDSKRGANDLQRPDVRISARTLAAARLRPFRRPQIETRCAPIRNGSTDAHRGFGKRITRDTTGTRRGVALG